MPQDTWRFDEDVTACFEDMLQRSIPQYTEMRRLVFDLGCLHVHPGDTILDLGCSRGDALAPFVTKYGTFCTYHGVEVSPPMLATARARFDRLLVSDVYGMSQTPQVTIETLDLRTAFPDVTSALTLSVLTLMFIPVDRRLNVIRDVYDHLRPGGVLLCVEKVLGSTAHINDAMVELYHMMKRTHGYTQEEVDRKRMSLEGVLVPLASRWNEDMFAMAGFTQVDCFWRWCNFVGWIALKG